MTDHAIKPSLPNTSLPLLNTGPTEHGWSRAVTVTRCPQLYAWTYKRGVELVGIDGGSDGESPMPIDGPAPAEPLIRGSLIHLGLAHHYAAMRGDRVLEYRDAVEQGIFEYEQKWNDCTAGIRTKVRQALSCYVGFHAADVDRYEIIGVEDKFSVVVRDVDSQGRVHEAPFTQRRDLVVKHRASGKVFHWDHKSTARIAARVRQRYTLSGQFLALEYFGRIEHGQNYGGTICNLIGMNPIDFERKTADPAPFRLLRWPKDYLYTQRLIAVLNATYGDDPKNWPGADSETACVTPYGLCPHFETCRWGSR